MTGSSSEQEPLDLRGLKCPLPALIAKRHLRALAPGGELTVIADDPMAAVDVPHMCHQEGFAVVQTTRDDEATTFRLAKPRG